MFIFNRMDRKNKKMKPSYTDFDRVKCIASTENQKHRGKPIRIADIISYYVLEVFVFDNTDVYSSED